MIGQHDIHIILIRILAVMPLVPCLVLNRGLPFPGAPMERKNNAGLV
jgi:hypothetical protein